MSSNPKDAVTGYQPAQSHGSSRSSRCLPRFFFLVVVAAFVYLAAFAYPIVKTSVLPEPPELSVVSASVDFDVSADCNVTLSLHNPSNMFTYHYKGVGAALMYGPTVLAEASLPDFHQSERNSTTLRVALAAAADSLEPNVAFGMRRGRDTDGAVVLRFDVWALVTFRPLLPNFPRMTWRVSCNEITIWFADDGTGTADPPWARQRCTTVRASS